MSELPTPAVVPAAHVVRVRLGGYTYTSKMLPPSEAKQLADELVNETARMSTGTGFVPFTTEQGQAIRIKARSVSAIEVGPPYPHKDRPRGETVHVHLYGASDDLTDLFPQNSEADREFLAGTAAES